jgi:heptosyltransferase I
MQMALRASIASLLIKSPIRVGFDRRRAKDCQWLFTNHKIDYKPHQHVMESFFGFSEALGLEEGLVKWDIPVPPEAKQFAEEQLPGDTPTLVISPCSSMAYRNWLADGYAAVARYAVEKHGMRVVLSGGPSNIEQHYGEQITRMANKSLINLIGKTSLKQLLAILDQATVIISPDAGPAHMGTAVGTPVIGLYATTNPDRARPYLSRQYVINHYPQAVRDKFNKPVSEVPWGTRVRDAGTMERITVREVTAMLDRVILNGGRILAS